MNSEIPDRRAQDRRFHHRTDSVKGAPMGPRDVARAAGVSMTRSGITSERACCPKSHARRLGIVDTRPPWSSECCSSSGHSSWFSLPDLQRVLSVHDRGGAPCRSVRDLVGKRLAELNERIEELVRLREELRVLDEWDRTLAKTPQGQRAHLLESLGSKSAIERTRRARRKEVRAGHDTLKRIRMFIRIARVFLPAT